jgi:hypothetical protein
MDPVILLELNDEEADPVTLDSPSGLAEWDHELCSWAVGRLCGTLASPGAAILSACQGNADPHIEEGSDGEPGIS